MAEKDTKKEEGDGEAKAAPAGKSNKKLVLIIGAVVGLLVLIGVPVTLIAFRDTAPKKDELAEAIKHDTTEVEPPVIEEEELGEDEEALGAIFPLETFVVNLKGGGFLRAQLQLEFVERDVPPRFFSRMVPTRDALFMLLTAKNADELRTHEGKDALKNEVRELVNEVLKRQEVKRVYITQFVVQ